MGAIRTHSTPRSSSQSRRYGDSPVISVTHQISRSAAVSVMSHQTSRGDQPCTPDPRQHCGPGRGQAARPIAAVSRRMMDVGLADDADSILAPDDIWPSTAHDGLYAFENLETNRSWSTEHHHRVVHLPIPIGKSNKSPLVNVANCDWYCTHCRSRPSSDTRRRQRREAQGLAPGLGRGHLRPLSASRIREIGMDIGPWDIGNCVSGDFQERVLQNRRRIA